MDDIANIDGLLTCAAEDGDLDKVKKLVNDGADVNYSGDLSFILSAYNGNLDVVKYLIKNGADIDNIGEHSYDYMLTRIKEEHHYETYNFLKLYKRQDKLSKNLVKIMLRNV